MKRWIARGWGAEGENGAQCSVFTGEVRQDERCADESGDGMCSVTVDESSA